MVLEPFAATRDVHVIPTLFPVPNVGVIPMNAFVLRAAEPVLVDTGAGVLSEQFLDALSSIMRIEDLAWIWLTHEDADHTGSLERLLELAPRARVATDFFAVGRMLPARPFPLDRLRLVTPGERLPAGDRELVALRPPLFDSPATLGLLDDSSGVLFSSDAFGAPLPTAQEAAATSIADLDPGVVAAAQAAWANVDSPWVGSVDPAVFARSLDAVRRLEPTAILSSHLPPAHGQTETMLANLAAAVTTTPPPATTQAQLDVLLAGMAPAAV
ncbi:oxygen-binding di-iron domain-containing protein [Parafrankia elaeagni]|uniref:MBL fold metallo-hydrolase n=1 Tax=Parafrankia elaeagni TaxID=222534 RepID=UPI000475A989|nr:MBL fold metallo-hydrolase [Parafrankia elaeagni]